MSQSSKGPGNLTVILFVVILASVCALVLSMLASVLKPPQETAKELDRSQQLLIAAKIYDPSGYFLIQEGEDYVPAKHVGNGVLEKGSEADLASSDEVLTVYRKRIRPILVDDKGEVTTFKDANMNEAEYTADHKKTGYYKQPLKLAYQIVPNPVEGANLEEIQGYVFPVNGFGLWDAIYGYIALKPDGNTVIGISWYEHMETPGLGANITEQEWQDQFPGKHVFQPAPDGKTDFATAPVGISVVRGKVSETVGDVPKAQSAVDGMPGATLTGNGVTKAYKDNLSAYRPFLEKLHQKNANS